MPLRRLQVRAAIRDLPSDVELDALRLVLVDEALCSDR
jgi:hypothetical protein